MIATAVSTLTTETSTHAVKLKELRKQKMGHSAEADELRAQLTKAEEEIAVLRLQGERAALLEVQTALAAQLVEDLQVWLRGLLAAGCIGRA
jgi:predicted  nucleic acid-binding Zn-ribbon protein